MTIFYDPWCKLASNNVMWTIFIFREDLEEEKINSIKLCEPSQDSNHIKGVMIFTPVTLNARLVHSSFHGWMELKCISFSKVHELHS